jgi:hypothetical protein
VVSQPPFKNTTESEKNQVVCASFKIGTRRLGSHSPTDVLRIPPFGLLGSRWWTLVKPSQGNKKGEETFGFSPLDLLLWSVLKFDLPYTQTGECPRYANRGNQGN